MPKINNSKEDFSFFGGENKDLDQYVDRSYEISDRILSLIEQKKTSKTELARKLNKTQSEISKWLTGTHNFTLKTLAKLEVALEDSIILPVEGSEYKKIYSGLSKSIDNSKSIEFNSIRSIGYYKPSAELSAKISILSSKIETQKLKYRSITKTEL